MFVYICESINDTLLIPSNYFFWMSRFSVFKRLVIILKSNFFVCLFVFLYDSFLQNLSLIVSNANATRVRLDIFIVLTDAALFLLCLQPEVRRVALRRVSEHFHRQTGLRQPLLSAHRAEVRHPLFALREAGADRTRTVSACQHAGGRRVRAEGFV